MDRTQVIMDIVKDVRTKFNEAEYEAPTSEHVRHIKALENLMVGLMKGVDKYADTVGGMMWYNRYNFEKMNEDIKDDHSILAISDPQLRNASGLSKKRPFFKGSVIGYWGSLDDYIIQNMEEDIIQLDKNSKRGSNIIVSETLGLNCKPSSMYLTFDAKPFSTVWDKYCAKKVPKPSDVIDINRSYASKFAVRNLADIDDTYSTFGMAPTNNMMYAVDNVIGDNKFLPITKTYWPKNGRRIRINHPAKF